MNSVRTKSKRMMETLKKILGTLFLFVSILLVSCDPEHPGVACNAHCEWFAENKTCKTILLEYVDNHPHAYTNSDMEESCGCIQQETYQTFVERYGNRPVIEELHARFLIDGECGMRMYMLKRGSIISEECSECQITNGTLWITKIYNLTDTTRYNSDGYEYGYYENFYTSSVPFTSLQWHYDPETDTNYTYCYLTIDSSALAAMQKDYSMLEQFADYYNGKQ